MPFSLSVSHGFDLLASSVPVLLQKGGGASAGPGAACRVDVTTCGLAAPHCRRTEDDLHAEGPMQTE